jgi:DNA-binding IclR family transcriptional regulator
MLSLSQISRLSGVTKSTTHRVLAMLVEPGAVERSTSSVISPATVGGRLPAHLTGVGKALRNDPVRTAAARIARSLPLDDFDLVSL